MPDNYKYNNSAKVLQLVAEDGKLPPQALDLEEVVLGAIMIEKDAILEVIDILRPDSFYKDAHQKIYRAITSLSTKYEPIDILTVTEELRKTHELDEVGGPYYITQLTSKVASAVHLEYHARIIQQKFIQRELIRVTSEIQNRAFDPSIDVDDLLDFSEKEMFNVAYGNVKKEIQGMDVLVREAINGIEEAGKQPEGLSGVPCGFTKLDRLTSGWQKSDLIIIAARPAMGKTAFVLSMARNIAVDYKKAIALFSLEMSSVQLVNRLIVGETELSSEKIKTGKLEPYEWQQLEHRVKSLIDAPIFIDDTPAISIFELRAKCRRLRMKHQIDMIIIDYLQLMGSGGDRSASREQEVSTISRGLKAIAKELNVPIIALSQLNRSVEMRTGDKRPQLSDLRESGAIEQDADMVLFIHRPEKYGLTEDENGNSTRGLAEIIVAKHRNGATDTVRLRFVDHQAKFTDYEDGELESLGTSEMTFSSKINADTDNFSNDNFNIPATPFGEAPF